MYKIDFLVGVTSTFLLSLMLKVKGLFAGEKAAPTTVDNILFIELSEMGSMVLLCPLLDRVRKDYPAANFYFITFSSTKPALSLLRRVDESRIWTLRITTFRDFLGDLFGLFFKMRKVRFQIAFDLEIFSRISAILSLFSRATYKVGFSNFLAEGLYRGDFLTHPVTYNPHQHISKNFLGMSYALKEPPSDIPHSKITIGDEEILLPPSVVDEATLAPFREKLQDAFPALKTAQKWVLLNPNSSKIMPLRRWPIENYLALARLLLQDENIAIAITGASDEKADAAYICAGLASPRAVDLTGFTTMDELIWLYHLSALLVSNDSGPAHFAALSPIPTLIFFGPETPHLYGSLSPRAHNFYKNLQCSPCSTAYNQRRSPCQNNVCVKQIEVTEVYQKAQEILQLAASPPSSAHLP